MVDLPTAKLYTARECPNTDVSYPGIMSAWDNLISAYDLMILKDRNVQNQFVELEKPPIRTDTLLKIYSIGENSFSIHSADKQWAEIFVINARQRSPQGVFLSASDEHIEILLNGRRYFMQYGNGKDCIVDPLASGTVSVGYDGNQFNLKSARKAGLKLVSARDDLVSLLAKGQRLEISL